MYFSRDEDSRDLPNGLTQGQKGVHQNRISQQLSRDFDRSLVFSPGIRFGLVSSPYGLIGKIKKIPTISWFGRSAKYQRGKAGRFK
jgi:hypothetical protein